MIEKGLITKIGNGPATKSLIIALRSIYHSMLIYGKNKHRIEKFKELGIDHYNAQTIDIGLIAVLTDVKTPNFEEVVKQMMLGDNEKYFKACRGTVSFND